MSRYIDAEEFKKHTIKFGEEQNSQELASWLCQYIDCFSTADVVEVVRCKDCAYCRYVDGTDIYKCDRRGFYSEQVKPTDYCSLGERRTE